jgi:hypothetical protein
LSFTRLIQVFVLCTLFAPSVFAQSKPTGPVVMAQQTQQSGDCKATSLHAAVAKATMNGKKISVHQFASMIRNLCPHYYDDLTDGDLIQRIVNKWPLVVMATH